MIANWYPSQPTYLPTYLTVYTPLTTQPPFRYSYGLHRRCSSITNTCEDFPQPQDCHGRDRYFCSMWRSVGFLMSFAVVLQAISVVSYVIIIWGNKQLREGGWRTLSWMVIMSATVQAASMAIVVGSLDYGLGREWAANG